MPPSYKQSIAMPGLNSLLSQSQDVDFLQDIANVAKTENNLNELHKKRKERKVGKRIDSRLEESEGIPSISEVLDIVQQSQLSEGDAQGALATETLKRREAGKDEERLKDVLSIGSAYAKLDPEAAQEYMRETLGLDVDLSDYGSKIVSHGGDLIRVNQDGSKVSTVRPGTKKNKGFVTLVNPTTGVTTQTEKGSQQEESLRKANFVDVSVADDIIAANAFNPEFEPPVVSFKSVSEILDKLVDAPTRGKKLSRAEQIALARKFDNTPEGKAAFAKERARLEKGE